MEKLRLNHKSLIVYEKSIALVKELYNLTSSFPKNEAFVLTNQIRKAATSICLNIAEGSSRSTHKERRRFYEIARSSLVEIDCQLEVATVIGLTSSDKLEEISALLNEIFRMLSKMISQLKCSN